MHLRVFLAISFFLLSSNLEVGRNIQHSFSFLTHSSFFFFSDLSAMILQFNQKKKEEKKRRKKSSKKNPPISLPLHTPLFVISASSPLLIPHRCNSPTISGEDPPQSFGDFYIPPQPFLRSRSFLSDSPYSSPLTRESKFGVPRFMSQEERRLMRNNGMLKGRFTGK